MATAAAPTGAERRRPTHFIALRVDDPLLAPALARVQAQVSAHFPELKACLVPPPRFHVTLLVLSLAHDPHDADAGASAAMDEPALLARFRAVVPALWARHILLAAGAPGARPARQSQRPFTLAFDGLASFVDGRGELRVLFAKGEEGEERRRLAGLVAALRGAMADAVFRENGGRGADKGEAAEGEEEAAFTPHVTLFKTSKDRDAVAEANKQNRRGPAQRRLEKYIFGQLGLERKRLGAQVVERLELLSMEGDGAKEGYFRVVGSVAAAEAAAAAASLPAQPQPPSPPTAAPPFDALSRRGPRSRRRTPQDDEAPPTSAPAPVPASASASLPLSKWVDRDGNPIPLLTPPLNDDDGATPLPKRPPRRARPPPTAVGHAAEAAETATPLASALARSLSLQPQQKQEGEGRGATATAAATTTITTEQTNNDDAGDSGVASEWVFLYDRAMGLGRACLPRDCHRVAFSTAAHADGWCLAFNGPGGKENLVPRVAPSDPPVWGVLHHLSPRQARHLAQAHAAQGMRPLAVQVAHAGAGTGGGAVVDVVEAVTYVCARVIRGSMHWGAQYSIVSQALPPPDRHLAALLNAARYWGLDRAYQQYLSALPVIPYAERRREYYDTQDNPLVVALSRGEMRPAGGGGLGARSGSGANKPRSAAAAGKQQPSTSRGPASTAGPAAGAGAGGAVAVAAATTDGGGSGGGGGRRARGRLQHKWL